MLFEPGPLTFLDPETTLPPRLTFGFEALAVQTSAQIEGSRDRLASHAATMASDLGGSPTGGFDGAVAAAAAEQSSQVQGEAMTLAVHVSGAKDLSDELAFVQGHFPAEGSQPGLPPVAIDPNDVFEGGGGVTPAPPAPPPPAPPPTPPPGDGDGGGGGGGGGGSKSAQQLLELYMQENPNERPRIEKFLRDNPGDYARAPSALDLPGWADFVRRHT